MVAFSRMLPQLVPTVPLRAPDRSGHLGSPQWTLFRDLAAFLWQSCRGVGNYG